MKATLHFRKTSHGQAWQGMTGQGGARQGRRDIMVEMIDFTDGESKSEPVPHIEFTAYCSRCGDRLENDDNEYYCTHCHVYWLSGSDTGISDCNNYDDDEDRHKECWKGSQK